MTQLKMETATSLALQQLLFGMELRLEKRQVCLLISSWKEYLAITIPSSLPVGNDVQKKPTKWLATIERDDP